MELIEHTRRVDKMATSVGTNGWEGKYDSSAYVKYVYIKINYIVADFMQ